MPAVAHSSDSTAVSPLSIEQLSSDSPLSEIMDKVFGDNSDPMPLVERRAIHALPGRQVIVWEGDAQTFQFGYVSKSAEAILGYPVERWVKEPTFWADAVVAPKDRDDAIAYCALATGQGKDHDFIYRAITADGRTLWLHDIVRVVKSPRGIAERLRGVMLVMDSPD